MDANQPQFSPEQLRQLLSTPQAAALMARLQQLDQNALNQAVNSALQGNAEQAKQLLQPMMKDEQLQTLAQDLRDSHGGI